MKYALIIGSNEYGDPKLAKLKTPAADSRALAQVLQDKTIGGFDHVASLVNRTETAVRRGISEFFADRKPDDLVLAYFSGHGILDDRGRLYLALKDTQTSLLKATAIPASFVADEMDSCRSKREILILDCCHSGAFERGTKGEQKAVTEATFEGSGYGRVVLTASDSTQYALEGDQVITQTDLSLFTHFLLQGLSTGEADLNNDGLITLDEWYEYTYSQVVAETPRQVPHKWAYRQQGDLVIARNAFLMKEAPRAETEAIAAPQAGPARRPGPLRAVNKAPLPIWKRPATFVALGLPVVALLAFLTMNSRLAAMLAPAAPTAVAARSYTEQPTLAPSAMPTAGPGAGTARTRPADSMTMMHVPEGAFTMGSNAGPDDEKPEHQLQLDAFWIDRTEITNAMYAACVSAGGCKNPGTSERSAAYSSQPVTYVTWSDALAYCKWVGARLPTEAEWEKAARGTDGRIYPWGNAMDPARLWVPIYSVTTAQSNLLPVGSFPAGASPYGLLDMAGNAFEFVADWYSSTYYAASPSTNPSGPASGPGHVVRGGYIAGFLQPQTTFQSDFRATSRLSDNELTRLRYTGFRCAQSAGP